MKRIAVFGAGGRAGRAVAAQAAKRGHQVTAIVRAPAKYPDLSAIAGDVTDAEVIAAVAKDHNAVVHAAADVGQPYFFPTAARAFTKALTTQRLVVVGLASVLPASDGTLLMDTPGYPQEYRSFYEDHQAGIEAFRESGLDWVALSPAGDFDHSGRSTGTYQLATAEAKSLVSYPDFALAVLDQIDNPTYHRVHAGVEALG